jgi:hypothetical protein
MKFPELNYKIQAGTASAAVLALSLCILAYIIGDDTQAKALNFTVLIFSATIGWLTGIIVSPYDPKEAKAFPKYMGAVSAFASGYLLSKVDVVFTELVKPELILSTTAGFRILAGISAWGIAVIFTYIYRTYAD